VKNGAIDSRIGATGAKASAIAARTIGIVEKIAAIGVVKGVFLALSP